MIERFTLHGDTVSMDTALSDASMAFWESHRSAFVHESILR